MMTLTLKTTPLSFMSNDTENGDDMSNDDDDEAPDTDKSHSHNGKNRNNALRASFGAATRKMETTAR